MEKEKSRGTHDSGDRRSFLKLAGGSSLGLLLNGAEAQAGEGRPLPPFSGETVAVPMQPLAKGASDEEVMAAVKRTAEAATDFSWLSRGDVVLLKPASNSANVYPATTSPLAVRAMVALLKEKGAGRVILADKPGVASVYQDADKHRGSSRQVLTHNGLHQAAVVAGAEVHYFEEAGYDAYFGDRPEHESHWKGELILPAILNQVDHVVLLPRVSRHVLAGSTLGLKAAVGWLRDDSRLELHRDAKSFLDKAAEINDARVLRQKLRLVLTVATKVQTSFGPDMGYAAEPDPGLVFASPSLLAHDMVSLGFLLYNREFNTPKSQLSWFRDPYQTYPGAMNRLFVGMTWGAREFFHSQTYDSVPLVSVRTDPVLSRAATIWGGVPKLELVSLEGKIPDDLVKYLQAKATA